MAKKQTKKQQNKNESSISESEQSATESNASTEASSTEDSNNVKEISASEEKDDNSEDVSSGEETGDASTEEDKEKGKQQKAKQVRSAGLEDKEELSCATSSDEDSNEGKDTEHKESESDEASSVKSGNVEEPRASKQSDKPQADDATVFVKGFDRSVTELMVEEEFGKIGKVVNVRMPKDRDTSENKGFCYVEFSNAQSAKKALSYNGKTLLDCTIVIDTPKKTGNFTLFVKNLPYTATVEDIKDVFSKYNVKNVRLPADEDEERNRGFCFVEFGSEQDMKKVLNGKFNMEERKLFINEPKDRKDRGNGGFNRDRRDGDKGFGRGNNRERRFNDRGGFNKNDRRNSKDRGSKRFKENENKKIVFDDNSD